MQVTVLPLLLCVTIGPVLTVLQPAPALTSGGSNMYRYHRSHHTHCSGRDSTISLTQVRSALTRLAVTQDLSQVQRIPLLHKMQAELYRNFCSRNHRTGTDRSNRSGTYPGGSNMYRYQQEPSHSLQWQDSTISLTQVRSALTRLAVTQDLSQCSTHTVTAQNAGGCTATSAPVTIGPVLTVPTAPALTQVDPTCTVTTGAITLTAVAGLNYQLDAGPFGPYPAGGYTGLVAGSTHTPLLHKMQADVPQLLAPVTIGPVLTVPTAPALTQVDPTWLLRYHRSHHTHCSSAGLNYQLDAGPFGPYPAGGYTGLVAGSTHTVTRIAQNAGGCTATSAPVTNRTGTDRSNRSGTYPGGSDLYRYYRSHHTHCSGRTQLSA